MVEPIAVKSTDPVTREVILSGIKAAVDEMDVLIGRTAMSPVIKDKKDYFMGVFDAQGRMIHVLTSYSGPGLVHPILDAFPRQDIQPGDIFFYNDPYSTKGAVGHLPDIVIILPFHTPEGVLLGFSVAYGHIADIGGLRYGSGAMDARDIFNEGVAYPPMRVGRGGEVDPTFMAMLVRNTRAPELLRGDWRALLAGCELGVERMKSLVQRWGAQAVNDTADWVIERSAARVQELLAENFKDGVYSAEAYADGSAVGKPQIRVGATLTKSGSEMVLDLTDSDDQVNGPLNYIASLNGAQLLMLMQLLVLDKDLGANQGSLTNLTKLIARPGSVVQPNFPAPINARAIPRTAVIACLADVMTQATGGKMTAPAPTHVLCHFAFPGARTFGETLGVGLGGRPFGDGPDVIYGSAQRNYPIEQVEPGLPLRVERYAIRTDSGGPGEFRGGCGVLRAIRVLQDCKFSPRLGNTAKPSPGVAGGHPGGLARVTLESPGKDPVNYPGVFGEVDAKAGDLVILETSGGGGWGNPLKRAVASVVRDVNERYVTETQAREVYGVFLKNGLVDEAATAAGPRGRVAA